MDIETFMAEMDKQEPQWYINFAGERALKTFARHAIKNSLTEEENQYQLRRNTGKRLFVCARATHEGLNKKK